MQALQRFTLICLLLRQLLAFDAAVTTSLTVPLETSNASMAKPVAPLKIQLDDGPKKYHHVIVLVHGYMGSDKELGYLHEVLEQKAEEMKSSLMLTVYSAKANVGRTTDGVANGGSRLAAEINDLVLKLSNGGGEESSDISSTDFSSDVPDEESKGESPDVSNGADDEGTKEEIPNVSVSDITNGVADQGSNEEQVKPTISLSIVANSLGGLYSRHALSEVNLDQVEPFLFCTTSSPHLGVTNNTFWQFPRWAESVFGTHVMRKTGEDLFLISDLVQDMALQPRFLDPLRAFRMRLALANAYGTDFLVPVSTAAFLASDVVAESVSDDRRVTTLHTKVDHPPTSGMRIRHSVLEVTTQQVEMAESPIAMSDSLNSLGWTKIFMDIRETMPAFLQLQVPALNHTKTNFTSFELHQQFSGRKTLTPFGHPLMVANSRSTGYRQLTANGRPIMDDLGQRLVQHIIDLEQQEDQKMADECVATQPSDCTIQ